jgi:hypothetical protein
MKTNVPPSKISRALVLVHVANELRLLVNERKNNADLHAA